MAEWHDVDGSVDDVDNDGNDEDMFQLQIHQPPRPLALENHAKKMQCIRIRDAKWEIKNPLIIGKSHR